MKKILELVWLLGLLGLLDCVEGGDLLDGKYWKGRKEVLCKPFYSEQAPCLAEEFAGVIGYQVSYKDFELLIPSDEDHLTWLKNYYFPEVGAPYGARCWLPKDKRVCKYLPAASMIFFLLIEEMERLKTTSTSPIVNQCFQTALSLPPFSSSPSSLLSSRLPARKPTALFDTEPTVLVLGDLFSSSSSSFEEWGVWGKLFSLMNFDSVLEFRDIHIAPHPSLTEDFWELASLLGASRATSPLPPSSQVLISCERPFFHPFFTLTLKEKILKKLGVDKESSTDEKNQIFFDTTGLSASEIEKKKLYLESAVKERRKQEEIVIISSPPLREIIPKLNKHCIAFVGTKQSVSNLARWCPPGAVTVELFSSWREASLTSFEEAQVMRHTYFPVFSVENRAIAFEKYFQSIGNPNQGAYPRYDWFINPRTPHIDLVERMIDKSRLRKTFEVPIRTTNTRQSRGEKEGEEEKHRPKERGERMAFKRERMIPKRE